MAALLVVETGIKCLFAIAVLFKLVIATEWEFLLSRVPLRIMGSLLRAMTAVLVAVWRFDLC